MKINTMYLYVASAALLVIICLVIAGIATLIDWAMGNEKLFMAGYGILCFLAALSVMLIARIVAEKVPMSNKPENYEEADQYSSRQR